MVSALNSGASGLGSGPGLFLGKTLQSHGTSLHPGTGEFNAGGNPALD